MKRIENADQVTNVKVLSFQGEKPPFVTLIVGPTDSTPPRPLQSVRVTFTWLCSECSFCIMRRHSYLYRPTGCNPSVVIFIYYTVRRGPEAKENINKYRGVYK